ncbi:MAG: DnaA regulatory inactivator Hda [Halioglobus sp.]|nr:DnaA regulatory inactivator Hda [Halioglobus sp.]
MSDPPQHQLPLAIRPRDDATFANFLVRSGRQPAVDALRAQCLPGGEPVVFLCGPGGGGKSHLLQACCQQQESSALYVPLAELAGYEPREVLAGLEAARRLCLDDLQAVAGNEAWEEALFHLFNRCSQSGCALVFAADGAPRSLGIGLADLQSRLSSGVIFQLQRLDDPDREAILRFRAQRRGLELPADVASYIVSRAPRQMEQLLALLDRLDEASLAHQRALSRPFVKQTLHW